MEGYKKVINGEEWFIIEKEPQQVEAVGHIRRLVYRRTYRKVEIWPYLIKTENVPKKLAFSGPFCCIECAKEILDLVDSFLETIPDLEVQFEFNGSPLGDQKKITLIKKSKVLRLF